MGTDGAWSWRDLQRAEAVNGRPCRESRQLTSPHRHGPVSNVRNPSLDARNLVVFDRYADRKVGTTDASILAVAERLDIDTLSPLTVATSPSCGHTTSEPLRSSRHSSPGVADDRRCPPQETGRAPINRWRVVGQRLCRANTSRQAGVFDLAIARTSRRCATGSGAGSLVNGPGVGIARRRLAPGHLGGDQQVEAGVPAGLAGDLVPGVDRHVVQQQHLRAQHFATGGKRGVVGRRCASACSRNRSSIGAHTTGPNASTQSAAMCHTSGLAVLRGSGGRFGAPGGGGVLCRPRALLPAVRSAHRDTSA